jgi:hypothetical protein
MNVLLAVLVGLAAALAVAPDTTGRVRDLTG